MYYDFKVHHTKFNYHLIDYSHFEIAEFSQCQNFNCGSLFV